MKFRTELKNFESKEIINYSKRILCIGSCFAEHLYGHLNNLKYKAFLNPCGITYNPISIANSIYYFLGLTKFKEDDIFEENNIFAHFDFHSKFSGLTPEEVNDKIKRKMQDGREFGIPDVLILSLGTAYTYFRSENREVVNNCHKIPQNAFEKRRLGVDEIASVLESGIRELRSVNPQLEVVITVSPVRHLRDGMVENNLSKSALLLAVAALKDVTYFPSYELLLDDLRDYRFYDQDLVHPSPQAIDYILSFFLGQCCSKQEIQLRNQILSISRSLAHRPFHASSAQHQVFLAELIERMKTIQAQSPVDFTEEIMEVKNKLAKR